MNNTSNRALDDSEIWTLILLAPFALPIVLSLVPGWWEAAMNWLVEHGVLVPAADSPLLTLPGGIAGMDSRRIILAVVCSVILIALAASTARIARQRRIDRRLQSGDRP